jgi:hypothetical protein
MASSDPEHNPGKTVSPQSKAKKHTDPTPGQSEIIPKIRPSPTHGNNPNNGGKYRKPWWKHFLEIIALLAVPVAAFFATIQCFELRKSNEINKGSLEINRASLVSVQRAFVTWKGFITIPRVEHWESEEKRYFAVK